MRTKFWSVNLEGRFHLEDLDEDGKIMLDVKKVGWKVVEWIYLAQNRDQWRAVDNTVMNLRIP
jgi:hypothetical protein